MTARVHPKTAGAGTGAALGIVITALLAAAHVHLSPELAASIATITAALGAHVAPAPRHEPAKHAPRASPQLTMYDSVDVGQIPAGAAAVAGYVDGRWPTYARLRTRFPRAFRLPIAVFAHDDAHCIDCEVGDATPEQAVGWVKRQLARGVHRPCVYASLSVMPHLLQLLAAAGVHRWQVRVWTAHYTYTPHLCSPRCGFGLNTTADATQYNDHAHGRNLDASLVTHGFWHR